jgi:hypothetical protein
MKDTDNGESGGSTGDLIPGFIFTAKKKLIDNKWTGIAAVLVVLIMIFLVRK